MSPKAICDFQIREVGNPLPSCTYDTGPGLIAAEAAVLPPGPSFLPVAHPANPTASNPIPSADARRILINGTSLAVPQTPERPLYSANIQGGLLKNVAAALPKATLEGQGSRARS